MGPRQGSRAGLSATASRQCSATVATLKTAQPLAQWALNWNHESVAAVPFEQRGSTEAQPANLECNLELVALPRPEEASRLQLECSGTARHHLFAARPSVPVDTTIVTSRPLDLPSPPFITQHIRPSCRTSSSVSRPKRLSRSSPSSRTLRPPVRPPATADGTRMSVLASRPPVPPLTVPTLQHVATFSMDIRTAFVRQQIKQRESRMQGTENTRGRHDCRGDADRVDASEKV
ncbi:hypothetical protein L1887_47099 [Cichorium endivia]|nr:hypothetical protein L1887_47099 [Cichorium endivia]